MGYTYFCDECQKVFTGAVADADSDGTHPWFTCSSHEGTSKRAAYVNVQMFTRKIYGYHYCGTACLTAGIDKLLHVTPEDSDPGA